MKVIFYPFFSQQDKRTGKFLLESDSGVKLYAYMAERMAADGCDVQFVFPDGRQCCGYGDELAYRLRKAGVERHVIPYRLAVDNLDRRLQWEPSWLRSLGCDLLFTQHEFLAYPLRCLLPDQRVVMECGIRPGTAWPQTAELFPMAWRSADLVHCNSAVLAKDVSSFAETVVWQFSYEDSVAVARIGGVKDVDVLFNARCSATNYSHHEEFLRAFSGSKLVVRVTDPTRYLGSESALDRGSYVDLLHRSRVVVGLTDNGYGGHAFVEAVAAGACPVALKAPEYEELLTESWPYYCDLGNIAETVRRALLGRWAAVSTKVVRRVQENVAARSYSAAWKKAKHDLEVRFGC